MADGATIRCRFCRGRVFSEPDEYTGDRRLRCINCGRDHLDQRDAFQPAPPQWEDSKRWYLW